MLINYIKNVLYLYVFTGFIFVNAGSFEDFFRAIKGNRASEVQRLLGQGFDPNTVDEHGQNALTIALNEEAESVLELLLNWSAMQIDARNGKDETPLMLAALRGNSKMVKVLIARDADVNKPGWTPLHYAATGAHLDIMNTLLERHAYIDAESPNGTTPLMMAAQYGSPQAVKLLLEAGADPRLRNQLGLSALDFAQRASRVDAVELLAEAIRATQPMGKW